MFKLEVSNGKSFYEEASFEERRCLEKTFERFGVNKDRKVVGESLLRLERVWRKMERRERFSPVADDIRIRALFEMLKFYKTLK